MSTRVMVAGIGNLFLGDDGFGVEVARQLGREPLPEGVVVADVGIRALHLAFALLDRPELLLVIDAAARGAAPGTLYLIEPPVNGPVGSIADAHGMNLGTVLAAVRGLGGEAPRMLLIGCEPAFNDERMGLSPAVEKAIPRALEMVRTIIERELGMAAASAAADKAS